MSKSRGSARRGRRIAVVVALAATVVAVADLSLSTRCGVNGIPIAAPVARALTTIGLSAVFFQDPFGVVTFDAGFTHFGGIRPRTPTLIIASRPMAPRGVLPVSDAIRGRNRYNAFSGHASANRGRRP